MEMRSLNFFKKVDGSKKEPETKESGCEQKQGHGCCFYDINNHLIYKMKGKTGHFLCLSSSVPMI